MDYSLLTREDPTNPLIEPDLITPEQFSGLLSRGEKKSGEIRLFAAVLVEAVETFHRFAFETSPEARQSFQEVSNWIVERDDPDLFSFESVCRVLDIEPAWLREGLLTWLEENRIARTRISARHLNDPRRRIARAA